MKNRRRVTSDANLPKAEIAGTRTGMGSCCSASGMPMSPLAHGERYANASPTAAWEPVFEQLGLALPLEQIRRKIPSCGSTPENAPRIRAGMEKKDQKAELKKKKNPPR